MDKLEGDGRGDTPAPGALEDPRAEKPSVSEHARAPEPEPAEGAPVPRLAGRVLGVVLAPFDTFEALDAGWGWGGPWLAIAGTGVLAGIVRQTRTDLGAAMIAAQQHALELMTDAQRRQLEQVPEDKRDMMAKFQVFAARVGDFAGPTVGTILAIVVMGGLLFVAAHLLGGKRDFVKSVVVAAHCKLIAIVGYAVFALGALAGNPIPKTSLASATNEFLHPVAAAALDGIDPIKLWHSFLLAIGLACSLGVSRRRAFGVVAAYHAFTWLFWIALAGLSAAAAGGR